MWVAAQLAQSIAKETDFEATSKLSTNNCTCKLFCPGLKVNGKPEDSSDAAILVKAPKFAR